jgi:hypothetical protein
MRMLLIATAALALTGGSALAQMGGSTSNQNMGQQLQNMQQTNPNVMRKREQTEDQATPETAPASHGHLSPTKTLPADQKAKIREAVIESGRAPRVDNLNFTVQVGASVPRNLRMVAVPQEIVAIYPEWSGFLYFVSGDEIIVVDPNTFDVVGVLEA